MNVREFHAPRRACRGELGVLGLWCVNESKRGGASFHQVIAQNMLLARPRRILIRGVERARLLSSSPGQVYQSKIETGELKPDACQLAALEHLDRLYSEMEGWTPLPPPPPPPPPKTKEWRGPKFDAYGQPIGGGAMYTGVDNKASDGGGGGFFSAISSFFGGGGGAKGSSSSDAEPTLDGLEAVPRGVYMHGGVG